MSRMRLFAAIVSLLTLVACGSPSGSSPAVQKDIPELVTTVPSDALVVMSASRCSDVLSSLDSTHVLRKLDLGRLARSRAVLSFCYSGSLVPILAIEGNLPAEDDTLSDVSRLLRQASSLKLYALHSAGGRKGMIVITPSEAQLQAVKRHIEEGTSILAASGFMDALAARGSQWDFTVLKNSGASRIMPRDMLGNVFSYRDMTSFIRTVSDWTVISSSSGSGRDISFVRGNGAEYFSNFMENVPAGGSDLSSILPSGTSFVIGMAAGSAEFREAYVRYKDAQVKLESYEKTLSRLKSETGKSPLAWEKEIGVKEVAIVCIPEGKVLMVRPSKALSDRPVEENPYRGFAPALYGSAFSPEDDSCTAAVGGWLVYGSRETLEAFIQAEKPEDRIKWPKGYRIVIYSPEGILVWGKKGINYGLSIT